MNLSGFNMKLSKRLEICLNYADGFNNLADIGTDHAQVPIAAVKRGFVSKAQAIDNKYGPYVIAFGNIKKANLTERITVKRGDGFNKIDDDTDVAIVSGLGGLTIAGLIANQDLKHIKRLILQPNDHPDEIRRVLPDIHYKVMDELIFDDKDQSYDVIVLEQGDSALSRLEIMYGPINLRQQYPAFVNRLTKKQAYLKKVIQQLDDPKNHPSLQQEINDIKEALSWTKKH
jgi:tRNA (adenine22-N1)-methyltransferase